MTCLLSQEVEEVIKELTQSGEKNGIKWDIQTLPPLWYFL